MSHSNLCARALRISATAVLLFGAMEPLAAQAVGYIHGTVSAAESNAPLAGAQIYAQGTIHRTVTNGDGGFVLALEAGTYTIQVSTLGRSTVSRGVSVTPNGTSTINIVMATSGGAIEGVQMGEEAASPTAVLPKAHPALTKVGKDGQPAVGPDALAPLVGEVQQHRKVIEAQQQTIADLSRRLQALEQKNK